MVANVVHLQSLGSILLQSREFWILYRCRKRMVHHLALLVGKLCHYLSSLLHTRRKRCFGSRLAGIHRCHVVLAGSLWNHYLLFELFVEQAIPKQASGGGFGICWICQWNLVLLSHCLSVGLLQAFARSRSGRGLLVLNEEC